MTFAVAFLVSLAVLAARGARAFAAWRQAPAVWALGAAGLFGYHFFYFVALGNAPAVDASLIAYPLPLLLVIFSALLPGAQLRSFPIFRPDLGLAGPDLLFINRDTMAFV